MNLSQQDKNSPDGVTLEKFELFYSMIKEFCMIKDPNIPAEFNPDDVRPTTAAPQTTDDPGVLAPAPTFYIPNLAEGQCIKCGTSDLELYRFTNGTRRHYATPAVAASWDPYWGNCMPMNCASLSRGEDMPMNDLPSVWTPPPKISSKDLNEGQAIKCDVNETEVYRYTNGQRRLYPDSVIAASWDPYWGNFVVADCSLLSLGEDMHMNGSVPWSPLPKILPTDLREGQAIKCDANETTVYRFTNGQRRQYPTPVIAASWDLYWGDFVVADCSSVSLGEDMPLNGVPSDWTPTKVPQQDLQEGQAVKCSQDAREVYRFANGTLRLYPTSEIAASWDPYWDVAVVVDCSTLPQEQDMSVKEIPTPPPQPDKLPPKDLSEGQAVKCDLSEPEFYRFTDGQRRRYPNSGIAATWDPYWDVFVVADCALLPLGPDMRMKPRSITDGQAVKCDADSNDVFRYWNETVSLYPSPEIAESWDVNWLNPVVVDCSSFSTSTDMAMKLPPPTTLPDGHCAKCDPSSPEIFRYTSGELRLYPTMSIAASWDPFWDVCPAVDCSGLPRGGDMTYNQPILPEGQSVSCGGPEIYRYTNGTLRLYTDPKIAESWSPGEWVNAITTDCSQLKKGDDMDFKPAPVARLIEGQTVRCGGVDGLWYRFACGEVRLYPDTTVASSWDPNWRSAVSADCSSLRFGDDMEFNQPALNDGQSVSCASAYRDDIYRFFNGTIRLYVDERIGELYSTNWTNAIVTNCSHFRLERPLTYPIAKVPEGHAVKCDLDQPETYRFSSDQRRLYPDTVIAASWDPSWYQPLLVDCDLLPRGEDMRFNQPSMTDGQTVKCDSGPAVFRYTNSSVRLYPDVSVAASWDANLASPTIMNCSYLARGPDMALKLPPPNFLSEGQAIKCDPNQAEVYRFCSGQRRRYPSFEIASSWDSNWGNYVAVDCSFLPRGADMKFNSPPVVEGQAVRCDKNLSSVFRYTNGTLRLYPGPAVASSWDPQWMNATLVDCSRFQQAPEMSLKLAPPTGIRDGQAVKCGPDLPQVYRYGCGQLRLYPDAKIASSWDPEWRNFLVIDCSYSPIADDMRYFSTAVPELPEGLSIKCPENATDTYRYCSGQRLRYPNERTAVTWDSNWASAPMIANCSQLPRGNDMLIKKPIVPDGQTVRCDSSSQLYRFSGGGIRPYPSQQIAASWDPTWYNAVLIDCTYLWRGPEMFLNGIATRPNLPEGQAVKCDPQQQAVYRYASGQLRWYPNPVVATSWDANWNWNTTMVNCSVFSRGPNMEFKQPFVPDGQAVKCDNGPNIYRFMNGSIRWYPDPSIAASWDQQWANPILLNCSSFSQGPAMPPRLPPPTGLPEGYAVKCDPSSPNVFRLTGGEVRWYPDPIIATSWDPEWQHFATIDCTFHGLTRGKDMEFRQPSLIDGQAVKCDTGPNIYRYTNGTIRWYPDPPTAASWDANWASPIFIDCSRLRKDADMSMKLLSPAGLPEGQAIKCDEKRPEVYRMTGGQRRWYPNPDIASSWDSNWYHFVTVDCSGLPQGMDMDYKMPIVAEGQAVKCDAGPDIFRYTNGALCWYPDPSIAESWDAKWASPIFVDCSRIPRGPEMAMKLPSPVGLPEGQAIQCDLNAEDVYRLASGQRRLYPSPVVAASWDEDWYNFIAVDCSALPRGSDMPFKQPEIGDGQAVKCVTGPNIFRYTNGTIRLYPNPLIAASWDPNWFDPIYVDCSVLPRGMDLASRTLSGGGNWKQLDGSLVQLSFDGKQLCGVNSNDDIWCASENIRGGGATNWRRLPGKLTQITVYGDVLYGVNREGKIYFGSAVASDPNWRELPGWLKQITTDNKQICGVNADGDVFCADTNIRFSPNWREVPGRFTQVALVNGRLFAVAADSSISSGRSHGAPSWVTLSGGVRQVSFDGVRVCGTNSTDDVWCASSGLLGSPNWTLTPGKMRYVVAQGGDMFAVNSKGAIYYRRSD